MDKIEIKPLDELPALDEENDTSNPFVIEENTYDSLSYEAFFNNHMRKNIPCIIKNFGNDWETNKKWITDDQINYDYLSNQYGNLIAPVTDSKNITFDSQPRSEMKFSDYINYWKGNTRNKMLYLKDWHLMKIQPDDKFYTVPLLFASDWLNEYSQDKQCDDFMFVSMGPTGSWIPIRADVYKSFGWSVNVVGRKRWILFPPGNEEQLRDEYKTMILKFEPKKHNDNDIVYHEIIQEKGDAIFIPSGWYHQVENDLDTISVNHNWVNGCNITNVWQALTKTLASVEKEIDELKDLSEFPSMCQNMLKLLFGMNCEEFANLITHIGEKRLEQTETGSNTLFDRYELGDNHCMYDLKRIHDVINMMTEHSTYINNDYTVTESFITVQDCLSYMF